MATQEESEIQIILKQIENYYGFVPKIFQELQFNADAFKASFIKRCSYKQIARCPTWPKSLSRLGRQLPVEQNTAFWLISKSRDRWGRRITRFCSLYSSGQRSRKRRPSRSRYECGVNEHSTYAHTLDRFATYRGFARGLFIGLKVSTIQNLATLRRLRIRQCMTCQTGYYRFRVNVDHANKSSAT